MRILSKRPSCNAERLPWLWLQLVNLPADRIASIWRKYLDAFATCLLHWGGDPQSLSGRRLERLYWESGVLWGSIQIKHPDRLAVSCWETNC